MTPLVLACSPKSGSGQGLRRAAWSLGHPGSSLLPAIIADGFEFNFANPCLPSPVEEAEVFKQAKHGWFRAIYHCRLGREVVSALQQSKRGPWHGRPHTAYLAGRWRC